MKISGIVVYNPDYDRLIKNIDAIESQVDCLILYLNSDIDKDKLLKYKKIIYLSEENNVGIARALNKIMEYAYSIGADWCLLLDQDTIVEENCIYKYERYINLYNACVLSPVVCDDNDLERKLISSDEYVSIDMCITSGSYNNVKVWKSLGGVREEYFIDYVDWEYCARVRNNGYNVYLINDVSINHQLGKKEYHSLLWNKIFTYNHNAFRKYYITRNTIVSYRLFPLEPKFAHPYLRTIKRLMLTILFEDDKINKVKSILLGVINSRKMYKKIIRKYDYGN